MNTTKLSTLARFALGLIFLVFGFDGLFHFVPLPPMPEAARAFLGTLIDLRLFYAVKAIEIASALLLLAGRRVPLALALLAPVVFNIVWFDAALDPASLGVGVLLVALMGVLFVHHRASFRPLWSAAGAAASSR